VPTASSSRGFGSWNGIFGCGVKPIASGRTIYMHMNELRKKYELLVPGFRKVEGISKQAFRVNRDYGF
jgi:hypothetical protein